MARWLIGQNGIVVNVVEAEAAADVASEGFDILPDVTGVGKPGDSYKIFKPLTATTLRLTLLQAGITRKTVEAAIAAIPDDMAREAAEIQWEYATEYHRDHPLIEQLGGALGLKPDQIDAMWQAANET